MAHSKSRKTIFFGNRKQMNQAFKIVAWLTVISLFAGYGIWGIKDLLSGESGSGIGTVNGLSIPIAEFKRNYIALSNFITMAKSQYGTNADMILQLWGIDSSKKSEDVILQKLIQEKVVTSVADSLKMKVSKDYVDAKLQDSSFMNNFAPADVFQGGRLNSKLLSEYLKNQNMSLDDFETQISESIKKNVLRDILKGLGYIPDFVLKDEFIKKYAKRKYSIVAISLDEYLKQAKEKGVTDSALESYFKSHQENYRVPEKRHANFWVFEPKNYDIVIEDKEIADYFEKNKSSYLKEGSSKEKPVYKDLNEVREAIANKLKLKKFTKQFGIDVNKVLIESKQSPASFTSYVTNKKAEALPLMILSEDNTKQSQKIFGLNKLKDKAFFVENGKGYIGELVKIEKSYIPALKDIVDKVKQDWFKKEAKDLAQSVLNKLASNKQKTIAEINTVVKGKLIKTDLLDPQKSETFKDLKDIGVRSDMLFNLEAIGQRAAFITDSSGLIIQLDVIDSIDQDLFEKKKSDLRMQIKQSQAQHIFNDWLKDLEGRATIKIQHKILAQILSGR